MKKIAEGCRVVVVDDVRFSAEMAADIAEEAGLVPVIISDGDGPFEELAQLLGKIQASGCSAAICDHRLSQTQFAQFNGAELVAELYKEKIPGILISTFSAIDSDTSIRLHRPNIPSVIGRPELEPDQILSGLHRCEDELEGRIASDRQPRRTLVRVVGISLESEIEVVDAIIHTWDPYHAVRFPLTAIENHEIKQTLRQKFSSELRLFAEVNIGCQQDNELFFKAFEFAPEPDVDYLTA